MGYFVLFVSQVENGRANPPTGESLKKFLKVYGVEQRGFTRMVTEFKAEISDLEILEGLLPRLAPESVKAVRLFAEQLLSLRKGK